VSARDKASGLLDGITGNGEWRTANGKGSASVTCDAEHCAIYLNVRSAEVVECVRRWQRDARFIAAAPTLVRELCEEVDKLRVLLGEACDVADRALDLIANNNPYADKLARIKRLASIRREGGVE
jgi:hypothetical protein